MAEEVKLSELADQAEGVFMAIATAAKGMGDPNPLRTALKNTIPLIWHEGWRACQEAAAEAADLAAAVDNGPDDYGDGMNRGASLVAATIRALEPPKVTP